MLHSKRKTVSECGAKVYVAPSFSYFHLLRMNKVGIYGADARFAHAH